MKNEYTIKQKTFENGTNRVKFRGLDNYQKADLFSLRNNMSFWLSYYLHCIHDK